MAEERGLTVKARRPDKPEEVVEGSEYLSQRLGLPFLEDVACFSHDALEAHQDDRE